VLLVILVGAGLLLNNLHITPFVDLAKNWWPLIVIVIGILIFIHDMKNYLWALLVVAVGIVWQLNALNVTDVNVWELFWPIVIIIIGLSIIVNRMILRDGRSSKSVSKAERDDITAVLSGTEQNNHSDDFKASKITAVMGGAKMDLRKAVIKKEATIEVFTFWGGVELVVPENVQVRCSTSNILGGVDDQAHKPDNKNAPILHVIGDVVMGGIEIKN
jgi:predicted membrane protein